MKKKITKREINELKHFDNHAITYDLNYNYSQPFTVYKINKKFNDLVSFIKLNYGNKPIKILEIGCGTGEYTRRIAKQFPKSRIVGLDISPGILKVAKNKCKDLKNVSFVSKSAYDTGYSSVSFDVIVGFYILHHIDIGKFNTEALKILKPKGLIYFYEPNILNPYVYIVKSNKFLKKMVGDSPDEWAINPLNISKKMKGFTPILVTTTEYVLPVNFLPLNLLVWVDRISTNFKYIPLLKYLGGSVQMSFRKK